MEIGKMEGICPVCGAENLYIDKATGSLVEDGKTLVQYETRTCACRECGTPVFNEKVDEFNRLAAAKAIRSIFPRLSLKTIRGLPIRYGISRQDFCIVMGVPKTISSEGDTVKFKLFEGDLPDEKLEQRLAEIDRDPKVWIEFLKLAEKKLSKEAFEKSMEKAKGMVD